MSDTQEPKIAGHVHIEWTGIGAKHIQTEFGSAFLIPRSVTPVRTEVWEAARPWLASLIINDTKSHTDAQLADGRLLEHGITVEVVTIPAVKGPGGKIMSEASSTTKITSAKDLMDMADSEARAIIAKIFDIRILQEYLESPEMDAFAGLKGAIERRIVVIEKNGAKKGSK